MAELTEEAVEAVEEVLDEVTDIVSRSNIQYAALGLTVGAAAGALAGFCMAKRLITNRAIDLVNSEVAEAVAEIQGQLQANYDAKVRALESRVKEPLDKMVQDLGYTGPNGVVEVEEEPVNAFDHDEPQPDTVWDFPSELKNRNPQTPYVLHRDEFMENENDGPQITLTYFAEDDVLADEHDNVLPDQDDVVGLHNLQRFGVGSGDPNVVYVHNPRLEIDYEINRSEGSYAREVHGFTDDELKHSSRRGRRSRFDDETSI